MKDETLYSIVDAFAGLRSVDAVLLSGSRTNDTADDLSDTDLYIYGSPSLPARSKIAERFAKKMELNNQFWETEDLWILKESEEKVEFIYRDYGFVRGEMQRIFDRHEAQVGYSTCVAGACQDFCVNAFDHTGTRPVNLIAS